MSTVESPRQLEPGPLPMELAIREADGALFRLSYLGGQLGPLVFLQIQDGEGLRQFSVPPKDALDALEHPYLYEPAPDTIPAAWTGEEA